MPTYPRHALIIVREEQSIFAAPHGSNNRLLASRFPKTLALQLANFISKISSRLLAQPNPAPSKDSVIQYFEFPLRFENLRCRLGLPQLMMCPLEGKSPSQQSCSEAVCLFTFVQDGNYLAVRQGQDSRPTSESPQVKTCCLRVAQKEIKKKSDRNRFLPCHSIPSLPLPPLFFGGQATW